MGGSKVCFFSVAVLFALLSSSCANPAPVNRDKTKVIPDKDSDHFNERSSDYDVNLPRDPNKHFYYRLVRYFTFGGILQGIAANTGLQRNTLVRGGAVQYQDQSSHQPGYQASHVIRVGVINPALDDSNEELNDALENYIGHTQMVMTKANIFSGVGGAIDRFQSDNLNLLASIDFTSTANDRLRTVMQLQQGFYDAIKPFLMRRQDNNIPTGKRVLQHDWVEVYGVSPQQLFEAGTDAYQDTIDGIFPYYYNNQDGSESTMSA